MTRISQGGQVTVHASCGAAGRPIGSRAAAAEPAASRPPSAAGDGDQPRNSIENVSDAIRGRATLLLGGRDAVGQARAIEGLYDEAERGVRA
jgi:hypothetical protein